MVNRNMKQKYGIGVMVPEPTVTNPAGGAAYERPTSESVLKYLLVGSSANTFYAGGKVNIDNAVKYFKDTGVSPEFLAKAIVYARMEGFNRELPILGLAVLSTRDVSLFKAICHKVLRNPHDWEMFIDQCKSGIVRKGLGRAIKTEMVKALKTMPQYQALKYPTAVFDMVNICRPNPRDVPVSFYVKNGGKWSEYVDTLENNAQIKEKMGLFYAFDNVKSIASGIQNGTVGADGFDFIASRIVEDRLPYEVMTSVIGKNEKCWNALYESAPYFNMVRNLNNFIKYSAINNDNVLEAANKVANADAVHKSMMYPFRFYQAWKNVTNSNGGNLSGAGLGVIKQGLERAIQTSLDNVPEIPGKTCIATDVSGSMSSKVNNDYTDISCAEVAGVFSAILKLKNKDNVMLPFDDEVRLDYISNINRGKSVQEIAQAFRPCGGTSLAAPVAYLTNRGIKVDTFIGITDNMEWVSSYNRYSGDGMFLQNFLTYKKMVNPKVKAYLITLQAYEGAPAPKEIEDVRFIYGWSDQVLKYIGMDFDAQTKKVESMTLT